MKLRIKGNSLRLRLTRKEVAELHDHGRVESRIEFTPERVLNYAVVGSSQATKVTSSFDGREIIVTVPSSVLTAWAEGDQVSIEGTEQGSVQLLIEKDFQCMHKQDERDPDAYPNPLAS